MKQFAVKFKFLMSASDDELSDKRIVVERKELVFTTRVLATSQQDARDILTKHFAAVEQFELIND